MPIEYLAVGRGLRPHGVRGDLVLGPLTDFPEHLAQVETVYVGDDAEPHALETARLHRQHLIIHLAGVDDREAAEAYRDRLVQIRADLAAPLPPGRFYHHQVVGLHVVTDDGEPLGEVVEVLETGANDVYVVAGHGGEVLLPAIKDVILSIDLEAQQMRVHLLDGLR
jgi:16S rRNA processing protein RimM